VITTDGKYHIKRYLATQVPQIGRCIALGIGSTAPALTDTRLNFEVARTDVKSVSYNFATNKLVWKANVPDSLAATVYEIGLYSLEANTAAGQADDRMITSFDSASEVWSNTPTWSTANTRIGEDSLRQSPAAGATVSNEVADLSFDLSLYSGVDVFLFAYNNLNTNTASVQVRFKTDDTNYFSYTATNPVAGYHVDTVNKATLVSTGTPNWAAINKIEVYTVSKASLVATVDWDGIRVADSDSINPDYVLVARETVTPFLIKAGSVNEIEFSVTITV